jgi:hypothetical protein
MLLSKNSKSSALVTRQLCARRRWWSYQEEEAELSSFLTLVPNTIGIYGRDAEKCAECIQTGGIRSHTSML